MRKSETIYKTFTKTELRQSQLGTNFSFTAVLQDCYCLNSYATGISEGKSYSSKIDLSVHACAARYHPNAIPQSKLICELCLH